MPVPQDETKLGSPSIVGVIILAGGTAARLGGVSKPDLMLGDKTLLERTVQEVRCTVPRAMVVAVAPPDVAVPDGVVRALEDPPLGGPVAGIAAGLESLQLVSGYHPRSLIALSTCDAPFAPRLYPALEYALQRTALTESSRIESFVGAVPVLAEGTGGSFRQYLQGIYRGDILEELCRGKVRDRSVRSFFRGIPLIEIVDATQVGMDVDTWEDATALGARLADFLD